MIAKLCLSFILLQGLVHVCWGRHHGGYGFYPRRTIEPTTMKVTDPPEEPTCEKFIIVDDGDTKVAGSSGEEATIVSVELVKEITYGYCLEGVTYSYQGDTLTVSHGCKGAFRVCYVIIPPVPVTQDPGCVEIALRSRGNKETQELINDGNGNPAEIISMELIEEYYGRPCIEWKSFFFHGFYAIVKFGCSGLFRVCYRVPEVEPTRGQVSEALPEGCIEVTLLSRLHRNATKDVDGIVVTMTIKNEFSGGLCNLNNYGVSSTGRQVYASKGCRAEFVVCLSDKLVDTTPAPLPEVPGCTNVYARSRLNEPVWIEVTDKDGRPVYGHSITLVRQESDVECIENVNFHLSGSKVHVSGGCRGAFRVCYGHRPYGGYHK